MRTILIFDGDRYEKADINNTRSFDVDRLYDGMQREAHW